MLEVDAYIGEEIFAEFFRFMDLLRLRARHVEVHGFVRLLAGAVLHEATTTPFDLHSASGLLLDVLDVGATLADDLSPQIETGDIFHIQENSLLWPFTLNHVSFDFQVQLGLTHSAKLISFDLFGFSPTEPPFVDKIGKFL